MDDSQILESYLLKGTPQEAAAFFKEHRDDIKTERALAIACRFCGVEYVKALVENGAAFKNFDFGDTQYWLAPLKFNENQRDVYRADEGDDCFENKIERKRADDNSVETFYILPEELRAEIVKYLCENSERVKIVPGELLFFSIMSNNQIITARLREMGVTFDEFRIQVLTENPNHIWFIEFALMLTGLGDGVVIGVIRDVVKEIGGKRIFFNDDFEASYFRDYFLYGSMKDRFFKPDFFAVFAKNFKFIEADRKHFLMEVINQNCPECLAQCAERGWLRQPEVRDEMIAYAAEVKSTECLAWLLDNKNRSFDLAAERAKAEKKALRELNAVPNSITALKNIWSWKKQGDGTLVITGYYGIDDVITVPPKVGKRAVVAIDKRVFSEKRIKKAVLPDGLRSIGKMAFAFSGIEEVVIPDSIVEIGEGAFRECGKLREISIPRFIKEIRDDMFYFCVTLRSIGLPAGIKRIGRCALSSCGSLEKITITDGTVEIGESAFSYCRKLKTAVIPASVKAMGKGVFHRCDIVTVIVEPNSYAEEYCKQNNIPFKYSDEKG